jgi:sterol desaturase/sphingolipid hydroxylase (fatty acid hydroxylase superfamily)
MFVMSWTGFISYMFQDYKHYQSKQLEALKLPTRHPLAPFWKSQLSMVPAVLFNELVVWPLVSLLVIAPQWSANYDAVWWSDRWYLTPFAFIGCLLVSDFMWYWSHRLLHLRRPLNLWKHFHLNHHLAPQCALSASYISWLEQVLFTVSIQLPWALVGFPASPYLFPLGWGMLTGGGAHSGYSGGIAMGDQHNKHHTHTEVNFGLLMIADAIFGTLWEVGDADPTFTEHTAAIEKAFPKMHYGEHNGEPVEQQGAASATELKKDQ